MMYGSHEWPYKEMNRLLLSDSGKQQQQHLKNEKKNMISHEDEITGCPAKFYML